MIIVSCIHSLALVRPTRYFLEHDLEQVKKRRKAYRKALQEAVHFSEKYCQVKADSNSVSPCSQYGLLCYSSFGISLGVNVYLFSMHQYTILSHRL